LVASASAVKINNNLSINGFIDGSYSNTDTTDKSAGTSADASNIGIDEVELNFIVSAGSVSGELHIDTEDELVAGVADNDQHLSIEQVHFTYSFGNGAAVQVGRFGSDLGLEREDPAGLYTFSRAYDDGSSRYNLGNTDANVGEGLRLSYSAGDFAASVALYNAIGATEEDAAQEDDLDTEIAVTYTGIDNLSVTVGAQTINTSDSKAAGVAATADIDVLTINAGYTLDKLLIAGEYTSTEADGSQDTSAYAVIADYDVTNQLGFALRYSEWETLQGTATVQTDKVTFAPNYAITESLGAIIEFSTEEVSGGTNDGDDVDSLAIELTYTF
jgi:hypothetical protein